MPFGDTLRRVGSEARVVARLVVAVGAFDAHMGAVGGDIAPEPPRSR